MDIEDRGDGMSIASRIRRLEKQSRIYYEKSYPIHFCELRGDDTERTRYNCPQCAAMSDEEYAKYDAWCRKTKSITHIVITGVDDLLD